MSQTIIRFQESQSQFKSGCDPMLLVASEAELPAAHRVWGTGGWLPPEQREALDWLTLSRLLGWGVTVTRQRNSGLDAGPFVGSHWIVLACDPASLGEEEVALLTARLVAEPILIVARAGVAHGAFARLAGAARRPEQLTGHSLRWLGPGPERHLRTRQALDASVLAISDETSTWVTLEGAPVVAARRIGCGVVATLGFHPSQARDVDGAATALLKHLLIWGSAAPVAWLDLEGSLILRMDDPGGAQNIYSRHWSYPKLGETAWAAVGADLRRRNARLSVGYVAGWVDDGDAGRGTLQVAGRMPDRAPGRIYPSPVVKYQDHAGHVPGMLSNYEAEFRGIQELRVANLGDVELHGYTHIHPDTAAWAQAPDRYEATSWYRELGRAAEATIASRPPDAHPLAMGIITLHQHFDAYPTTLICPGDQWTNSVLERALDLGLRLVSSYYLALRDGERFCWMQHVCAPYLDQPDAAWFDAGLPVVGYFHDRELALEGVPWLSRWLDRWQEVGAKTVMDFRELAAATGRRLSLKEDHKGLHLTVTSAGAPSLVRPLPVCIRMSDRRLPAHVSVWLDDRLLSLPVHSLGEGVGRVILPCSSTVN
jgi:hypothetical protein